MADHIIPSSPGMPDSLFFSMQNLRASCRFHNSARGWKARLDAEGVDGETAPSRVNTEDYS